MKKKVIIMFLVALIVSVYAEKLKVTPMEEFNIPIAIGFDINKELKNYVQYNIPISIYNFKNKKKDNIPITTRKETVTEEISSSVLKGKASSIGRAREDSQLKSSKPLLIGLQKIVIMSEEQAAYGILNAINIFFNDEKTNDKSIFVVCKGKAEDILKFKIDGYPSSADYMESMVKSARNYNFIFSEYNLFNIYVTLDSEGKNLVLPYLEIKEKELAFTGMALFKEDKLAYVLPMDEGKIMNMLREKKGTGILNLQEAPDKYINYDAEVKRKVKCIKTERGYEFNIELDFQGDIIENTLYKSMEKEKEKEFEKFMGKKIEKICNDFLAKMKDVYKIDCLNLGMYAVAKYGRETGVDWNKEVSNADIKVSVKVKVDKIGIGQY
ncbi:Ger(x)C family spore germination protein [Clostridium sp. CS001]|uniref:Ger(x)C family spore germination protein n=1 Tax=Clostridium sp. CS001 TaxID=2880648 RepID=UPI001CF3E1FE|nr:Ger(x)C family spore germination protein [Clostridium sp. CS001]MCB2289772.1 Ger(x)C family spore germination protein [Clostridium sp. CS001]